MLQRAGKNKRLETAKVEKVGSTPPQGSTEREKQPSLESTAGGQCLTGSWPQLEQNEEFREEREHTQVCDDKER